MKRCILFCLYTLFCVLASHPATLHPDTVAARMWRQLALMPQEKLYTQTNCTSYAPGDTIWMRHHIAEETAGTPALASRYVYVELINPQGNVVSRNMMRQEPHGAICGYVATTTDMATGNYLLRAYTQYMAETSPAYLFCRWIRLRDNTVSTNAYTNKNPEKILANDTTISIHIMPEGGHLVIGQRCRVAYKIIGADGLGVDMSVIVTNDIGERVVESATVHCGMGAFYITPLPNRTYTMTCGDGSTHYATVTLPKAISDTPAIQVEQNASNIVANIVCSNGFDKLEKTWLIVSQRGAPVYARPLETRTIRFSRQMFRDGVVHFMLADNKMNIISERMAFIMNGKDLYTSSAAVYVEPASRGMYRVDMLVPDNLEADCAVSVTSDKEGDDEENDIASALLLTQELDGMVESPSWYFADGQRMVALDILMLTQRMLRYDMQAVLKGHPMATTSYPEAGMQISGRVTMGKSSNGVAGAKVTVVANRNGYTDTVTTDDEGRFVFSGFELPDSTAYMFAAINDRGKGNVTLRLDGHRFPDLSDDIRQHLCCANYDTTVGARTLQSEKTVVLPELSVVARQTPRKTYESLAKFGGRSIRSDELEREKSKDIMSLLRSAGVGLTYDSSKEWMVYRRKPVCLIIDDTSWTYDTIMAVRSMSSILSGMTARQVKQIDIVKGAVVGSLHTSGDDTYGSLSNDLCAVVVTTRREDTHIIAQKRDNVAAKLILGYQTKANFDNVNSMSSHGDGKCNAVYWNPTMVMYGKTSFLFRPNDACKYRIVVEGISRQGQIIHLEKHIYLPHRARKNAVHQ